MNPQLLLEEIATGAVAAASSGHRVVNHVPFTEYVVSVDLARALEAAGTTGAFRTAMQQQLRAPRPRGTRARALVRIVAGVDGAGRLAQLQASLPGSKLGDGSVRAVEVRQHDPAEPAASSADGRHRIAPVRRSRHGGLDAHRRMSPR